MCETVVPTLLSSMSNSSTTWIASLFDQGVPSCTLVNPGNRLMCFFTWLLYITAIVSLATQYYWYYRVRRHEHKQNKPVVGQPPKDEDDVHGVLPRRPDSNDTKMADVNGRERG